MTLADSVALGLETCSGADKFTKYIILIQYHIISFQTKIKKEILPAKLFTFNSYLISVGKLGPPLNHRREMQTRYISFENRLIELRNRNKSDLKTFSEWSV